MNIISLISDVVILDQVILIVYDISTIFSKKKLSKTDQTYSSTSSLSWTKFPVRKMSFLRHKLSLTSIKTPFKTNYVDENMQIVLNTSLEICIP